MWLIMLMRLAQLILFFVLFLIGLYFDVYGIVLTIFLVLIGTMLLMVNAWNVALIGDVTGTRRAMGITMVSLEMSGSVCCRRDFELIVDRHSVATGWMSSCTSWRSYIS